VDTDIDSLFRRIMELPDQQRAALLECFDQMLADAESRTLTGDERAPLHDGYLDRGSRK